MAYNSTSWTSDGLTKAGATSTTSQSLTTGTLTANTLTLSEGNLTIPATYKVYFDGGGDTYMTESSADIIQVFAGGSKMLQLDQESSTKQASTYCDEFRVIALDASSPYISLFSQPASDLHKIYVAGSGYGADTLQIGRDDGGHAININGSTTWGVDDTGYDVKFFGATSGKYMLWDESADSLVLSAASKLYFDGGGDTYITESSADVLDFYAGGVNSLRVDNDQIIISTSQLHFTNDSGAEILMSGTSAANIYSQSSFGLLAGSGGSDAGHYLSFGSAGSNSQMILKNGDVGIGITAPDNKLHVKNADGNSKSVIKLEQLDTDEPFILFTGTTAADQTKSLSTDTDVGALEGHILVSINGADKWIAYYAQD